MKDFSSLQVDDYLRIFWKRKWYFVTGFVFVCTAAVVYAMRAPAIYRSETKIIVESASLLNDNISPYTAMEMADARIEAIRQQIYSRSFLEPIIVESGLSAMSANPAVRIEDLVNGFKKRIEIARTSSASFAIAVTGGSPQYVQTMTKKLADELIRSASSSQKQKAVEKDQFLEQQLSQAERDLANQEDKIEKFKREHLGELPEQAAVNMNFVSSLNAQLIAVENALDRLYEQHGQLERDIQDQKRLDMLQSTPEPTAPNPETGIKPTSQDNAAVATAATLAQKEALLAQKLATYTDKHPDVVALKQEVDKLKLQLAQAKSSGSGQASATPNTAASGRGDDIAARKPVSATQAAALLSESEAARREFDLVNTKNLIAKREKDRDQLSQQITYYQHRLNLAPALEQELQALTANRASLMQNVTDLKNRKYTAQLAASAERATKNELLRILDEATLPQVPVSPDRPKIIILGLMAGFCLGIVAAFGREFLDSTIESEQEATALLHLPVLITIPQIPAKGMQD
jgi:polysaccharide chain length determinant protein (PEP-CTERM system associated)